MLGAHAKFHNPRTTPSGRIVRLGKERENNTKIIAYFAWTNEEMIFLMIDDTDDDNHIDYH